MSPKLLIIGTIWPEPQSSAAGLRSMSLLRIFQEAGWEVHFASPAVKEASRPVKLDALGVRTQIVAPNDPSFDRWIAELGPDAVLFDRFMIEEQFGWRVSEQCPGAVRILDTVDLHFLRRAREAAPRSESALDPARVLDPALLAGENAYREVASIYRCDLTLLISDFEMKLMSDPAGPFRVPAELLREFSLCYDSPPLAANPMDSTDVAVEEGRAHFMFIGGFRHEPNADGVRWLRQEIWPLIRRRLPRARVDIYGAYPTRQIMDLSDPAQGFEVKGPATDQFETLRRHLINLAPLRFGAGLKGKIADGWWSGTPCVSTRVGAEGMMLEGRFGGEIADDPDAFAEAACRLHESHESRDSARRIGYEIISAKFDHGRNASRLLRDLEAVRGSLPEHRAANFTGRMLSHHAHRSTKYFSQWIELKNQ